MRKWSVAALTAAGAVGLYTWLSNRVGRPKTPAEAAIKRVARAMSDQEREVFKKWLAIPNLPDNHGAIRVLQSRYGRALVRRADERFESVRAGLDISFVELLEAARQILRVRPRR